MALTVPQDEAKRLINQILATFNQQVGLSGEDELDFDKVDYEFVEPREGYRNGIRIFTDEVGDTLEIVASIDYVTSAIVDISPFRLELKENAANGPESKHYVAQAKLPIATFPTAAKILYIPTGKIQFSAISFTGDTVTITRTGGSRGAVTLNVRDGVTVLGEVEFEDGDVANKTFDTNLTVPKVVNIHSVVGAGVGGRIEAVVNGSLVPAIVWTAATGDFELANAGDDIVLDATRSQTGGALNVPVLVTFGEDDPVSGDIVFGNGQLSGSLTIATPNDATSYSAVIQTGNLHTRGLVFTKTGDITVAGP